MFRQNLTGFSWMFAAFIVMFAHPNETESLQSNWSNRWIHPSFSGWQKCVEDCGVRVINWSQRQSRDTNSCIMTSWHLWMSDNSQLIIRVYFESHWFVARLRETVTVDEFRHYCTQSQSPIYHTLAIPWLIHVFEFTKYDARVCVCVRVCTPLTHDTQHTIPLNLPKVTYIYPKLALRQHFARNFYCSDNCCVCDVFCASSLRLHCISRP